MGSTIANGPLRGRRRLLLAIGFSVTLAVIALIGLALGLGDQPKHEPVRQAAWDKISPLLVEAEYASAAAGDKYAERIEAFFAERKRGARAFSEEVLGFWGKVQFVKSQLPFTEDDSYDRFLRETFEHHLFKGEDLTNLIAACVEGYASELIGIENETLLKIRADLSESDLASADALQALRSDEAFRQAYARMVEQVLPIASRDLAVTGGREAASWLIVSDIAASVAIRVCTAVAARLGLSAEIVGFGAVSGVATLGVGAAAAYLADKIIDWVMMELLGYDPAGDIAAKVCESLDEIEWFILEGDEEGEQAGLRWELQKLQVVRSGVCREALKKLILEGGGQ